MPIIILGFTFILAAEFPVGELLLRSVQLVFHMPVPKPSSVIYWRLLSLALSYGAAALLVNALVRRTHLKERIPPDVSGKGFLLAGVVIIAGFAALRLFASTIPGGGISLVVGMGAFLPLLVAKGLLYVGAVNILVSVRPNRA